MRQYRRLTLLILSSLSLPLFASGYFGPPLSGTSSKSTSRSSTSASASAPKLDDLKASTPNQTTTTSPAASTAPDPIPSVSISSNYGNLDDLSQTRAATPDQVREYITLTHAIPQTRLLMHTMTQGMEKVSAPYLPQPFWDDYHTSIDQIDLQSALIPAYQKYFSQQDMEQVLVFYRTPAGQRLVAVQPLLGSVEQDTIHRITTDLGREVAARHASEIATARQKYDEQKAKDTLAGGKDSAQHSAGQTAVPKPESSQK